MQVGAERWLARLRLAAVETGTGEVKAGRRDATAQYARP